MKNNKRGCFGKCKNTPKFYFERRVLDEQKKKALLQKTMTGAVNPDTENRIRELEGAIGL